MNPHEQNRRRLPKYLVVAFMFFIALLFITAASLQLLNRVNIHKNGVYATGTVYAIKHVIDADTDILSFTVKFGHGGQDYLIENENKSIAPRYKINEKLRVKFIENSPEKAIIDDPREQEYNLGFFLPIGIGLAVLILIIYVMKKDKDFSLKRLRNAPN